MNCPNCQQTIEAGAAFCGNCGQPVAQTMPAPVVPASPTGPAVSPIAQVLQNQPAPPTPLAAAGAGNVAAGVPSYALATPAQQRGEKQALLAVLFGVAGIAGALFIALLGLALGIAGIIMGTMARSGSKRALGTAGLVLSSLAVLAGLGVWTYAIQHDPALHKQAAGSTSHGIAAPAVSASNLSTPCYSAGFASKLNISNDASSCDMEAFNGATLNGSSEIYKIYADTSQTADQSNFTAIAKSALEKDLKDNLPGFTLDSEKVTEFAGSSAYVVNSSDTVHHAAVIEAAVLHKVAAGDNVFIMVHAAAGDTADLKTLEAQWQWK
jgi:hypothetical protein